MHIIFIFFIALSLLLSGCKEEVKKTPEKPKQELKTVKPSREFARIIKIFPATVSFEPDGVVNILPQISGKIDRIYVKVGDSVKKGQILAKLKALDTTDIQSNYYSVKTQLLEAKRIYELNKKLFEVGAISKSELIASEANLKQLEYTLKGLEEKQRMLGISNFSDNYIRSPIDGVVYEIPSTIGSIVSPDSPNPVAKIANKDKFLVVANIYEKDIGLIDKDDNVKIILSKDDKSFINGKVIYISDVLDPETRTVKVYIKPEKVEGLRANMFISVELEKSLDKFMAVNKKAILFKDNKFFVFVLKPDGNIEKREVQIITDSVNPDYSIVKGISEDQNLILDPINLELK